MVQKSEKAEHAAASSKDVDRQDAAAFQRRSLRSAPIGRLSAARAAVQRFLSTELGAQEVRITKIVPGRPRLGGMVR